MYSYEMHNFFQERDWKISPQEFWFIQETCPQICHIKLEDGDRKYFIETKDNYNWFIKIT